MRIVFLGPPGAGKGTQAAKLAQKLGIPHVSTGEMLRAAIASGSPLGLQVKGVLDAGELVSDSLMLTVIEERLRAADCGRGFILDGFPRTIKQCEDLAAVLSKLGVALSAVLELQVPSDMLVERMRSRAAGSSATRSDDNDEVFRNRLKVYEQQTAPVSGFYLQAGLLRSIDGTGSIDQVQGRLLGVVSPSLTRPA